MTDDTARRQAIKARVQADDRATMYPDIDGIGIVYHDRAWLLAQLETAEAELVNHEGCVEETAHARDEMVDELLTRAETAEATAASLTRLVGDHDRSLFATQQSLAAEQERAEKAEAEREALKAQLNLGGVSNVPYLNRMSEIAAREAVSVATAARYRQALSDVRGRIADVVLLMMRVGLPDHDQRDQLRTLREWNAVIDKALAEPEGGRDEH